MWGHTPLSLCPAVVVPVAQHLMRMPMTTLCGHTFDKSTIKRL